MKKKWHIRSMAFICFGTMIVFILAMALVFIAGRILDESRKKEEEIQMFQGNGRIIEGEARNELSILGGGEITFGSGDNSKMFEISINEYNEINKGDWQLIDVYWKNNCRTSLWRNKQTLEEKEIIGISPPGELLVIE